MSGVKLTSPEKAEKQRQIKLIIIASCVIVMLIAIATALTGPKKPRITPETFTGITPSDSSKAEASALESRFRSLELTMKQLQEDSQAKEREIARLKEDNKKLAEESKKTQESSRVISDNKNRPNASTSPVDPNTTQGNGEIVLPPKLVREDVKDKGLTFKPSPFAKPAVANSPAKDADNSSIINADEMKGTDSTIIENESVPAQVDYVKNNKAGWLPGTSQIPIVIYTGIDALTGGGAQGNPAPVHFRFQDDADLPGNNKYRLAECRGVATGYGELSTVRVQLRATRLVCVDVLEDKIIETAINGFITDSDSIAGMRGPVENREGAILGKAFIASFIQGSADLLAATATPISVVDGAAVQNISASQALRGGVYSGTSNAAEMLAQRYIEQMESIMPTITVAAGRKGMLHISEGKSLVWEDYSKAYTKQIKPVTRSTK